jgi:hypothetical protein
MRLLCGPEIKTMHFPLSTYPVAYMVLQSAEICWKSPSVDDYRCMEVGPLIQANFKTNLRRCRGACQRQSIQVPLSTGHSVHPFSPRDSVLKPLLHNTASILSACNLVSGCIYSTHASRLPALDLQNHGG